MNEKLLSHRVVRELGRNGRERLQTGYFDVESRSGLISSKNRLEKAEKEKKYKFSFRSVLTR